VEEVYAGQSVIISLGFLVLGFFFHAYLTKTNAIAASKQAKAILKEAQKEADATRREAKIQAKDAILRARENSERELTARIFPANWICSTARNCN
jgi:ribonuclease Y